MSKQITISGSDFTLPTQGTNSPWGDDLSEIIEALVAIANSSTGPSDILTTNFSIANNQSSVANVVGLAFDATSVRSAIISYSIYRTSSTTEMSECGQMLITLKSTAGTWELAQYNVGSSGVVFSITNAGQIQYTSTNFSGISYSGKLKFSAKAMLQA